MITAASLWWFVQRYWKAIAVLSAMLLALLAIHNWMERECARREIQLRQEYDRLLREAEAKNREIETRWRNLVHEADRDHHNRLQAMEAKYRDAVSRIGPVRVCPRASDSAAVPRDPPSPGVDHDAAGGDGLPGGIGGRDIGPGLVRIARTAEAQTAQLIACQNYIRALESAR